MLLLVSLGDGSYVVIGGDGKSHGPNDGNGAEVEGEHQQEKHESEVVGSIKHQIFLRSIGSSSVGAGGWGGWLR